MTDTVTTAARSADFVRPVCPVNAESPERNKRKREAFASRFLFF